MLWLFSSPHGHLWVIFDHFFDHNFWENFAKLSEVRYPCYFWSSFDHQNSRLPEFWESWKSESFLLMHCFKRKLKYNFPNTVTVYDFKLSKFPFLTLNLSLVLHIWLLKRGVVFPIYTHKKRQKNFATIFRFLWFG